MSQVGTSHLHGLAPVLIARLEVDGWDVLLFEALDGHHVDYSPDSADLPTVVTLLDAIPATPFPPMELRDTGKRLRTYVTAGRPTLLRRLRIAAHRPEQRQHHRRHRQRPDRRLGLGNPRRRVARPRLLDRVARLGRSPSGSSRAMGGQAHDVAHGIRRWPTGVHRGTSRALDRDQRKRSQRSLVFPVR
jgi:hypothetical protein